MARARRSRWPVWVGAAALGLLGYGLWRQRRDARLLEAQYPPSGQFVELADGSAIHYLRRGPRSGPTVALIHGADGTCCGFLPLVERLAERYDVIAFDRPGHGWSTIPDERHARVPDNVAALHEALGRIGVSRPILVGHSYGAAVALAWSQRHPHDVRGTVLVSPAAYPAWSTRRTRLVRSVNTRIGRLLTVMLMPLLGAPVLDTLLIRVGFGDDPVPHEFRRVAHAFYLRPSQFYALAHEYATVLDDLAAIAPGYAEVAVPTVIVGGTADRLTTPAEQAKPLKHDLGNARLRLVPGAAHELLWYYSDAAMAAVDELIGVELSAESQPPVAERSTPGESTGHATTTMATDRSS